MRDFESYEWNEIRYPSQYAKALYNLALQGNYRKGLEVGFDAGASALAFLRACPEATLTSVEIEHRPTDVERIKRDEIYGRLKLVFGDSRLILKGMASNRPEDKFDWIYVDGDHLYDAAKQDIVNSIALLAPGGIIVVDDADPSHAHFGVGKAVDEVCAEYGFVKKPLEGSVSAAVYLIKQ